MCNDHGTYIRWQLRTRYTHMIQIRYFDLLKVFSYIGRVFSRKRPISLYMYATCSELPTNISTMVITHEVFAPFSFCISVMTDLQHLNPVETHQTGSSANQNQTENKDKLSIQESSDQQIHPDNYKTNKKGKPQSSSINSGRATKKLTFLRLP